MIANEAKLKLGYLRYTDLSSASRSKFNERQVANVVIELTQVSYSTQLVKLFGPKCALEYPRALSLFLFTRPDDEELLQVMDPFLGSHKIFSQCFNIGRTTVVLYSLVSIALIIG